MNIRVDRDTTTDKSVTGTVYLDGQQMFWSLEPLNCIPAGTYKVVTYPSPHFGRLMPLLVDVPGRSTIEIHWLNYPDESRGCIGLGLTRGKDFIGESRMAFDDFWAQAQGPMERGECQITVNDAPAQAVNLDAQDL